MYLNSNFLNMSQKKDRVGLKFLTNDTMESFIIIEYFDAHNCTVRFEDNTIVYNKGF